ncbi:putative BLUF domain-containing protein [Moraxella osloensis]|nr:putative BLUF domain-containing protein [Moraxella osloensis]
MMSPPTYYLTYTSSLTWSAALKPSTFTQIYQSARDNNQKTGIMGFILFKDGRFLHFMEGSEMYIANLYLAITHDKRHHKIHLIHQGTTPAKRFKQCDMLCVTPGISHTVPVISELLAKFETYQWQTEQVEQLLNDMVAFYERDAADIAPYQVKTGSYIGAIIKHRVRKHLFFMLTVITVPWLVIFMLLIEL